MYIIFAFPYHGSDGSTVSKVTGGLTRCRTQKSHTVAPFYSLEDVTKAIL